MYSEPSRLNLLVNLCMQCLPYHKRQPTTISDYQCIVIAHADPCLQLYYVVVAGMILPALPLSTVVPTLSDKPEL
jgi:hypothetical protein